MSAVGKSGHESGHRETGAISTVAAWYLVIPQFFTRPGQHELVEFLLFVGISAVDVGIAVLLNKLVDRLIIQQRNISVLLESAPNGFVLVDEKGTIKAQIRRFIGSRRRKALQQAPRSGDSWRCCIPRT